MELMIFAQFHRLTGPSSVSRLAGTLCDSIQRLSARLAKQKHLFSTRISHYLKNMRSVLIREESFSNTITKRVFLRGMSDRVQSAQNRTDIVCEL
jgi:hypothetical protein